MRYNGYYTLDNNKKQSSTKPAHTITQRTGGRLTNSYKLGAVGRVSRVIPSAQPYMLCLAFETHSRGLRARAVVRFLCFSFCRECS